MRILLVATFLMAAGVPFCVPEAMAVDDDPLQGLNPSVKEVVGHKLEGLQKNEGLKPWLKELGFESLDEVSKVSIDPQGGFPLYSLKLDKLKSYEAGTDPWRLLDRTNVSIYALMDGQEVRSSATVLVQQHQTPSKTMPRVVGFGSPEFIRLLTQARSKFLAKDRCSECFVVGIPALGLHLFGYRPQGADEFKVVRLNDVHGHVTDKDILTANEVFKELSNQARALKYDRRSHRPNEEKYVGSKPQSGGG